VKPIKYTLFIDESGDHSLNNINEAFPVFALLGLLIENRDYITLCEQINKFKIKYFGTEEVILHSRDIRKCEGPFSILFNLDVKENFYNDLNFIISHSNFTLISSAILKQEYVRLYGKLADDPYEISLTFVLERALFKSDIIIESRGKREDQTLAKRYNELLYRGSSQVARHVLYPTHPYPAFDVIKNKIRKGRKGIDGYGLKIFP